MIFSTAARRFAALAAAFGIALQALWPAIAQARPADTVSVPVCSADGTRHEIEVPLGKTQDGSQHCKLCVLGLDKPVVSSAAPAFVSFAGKCESAAVEEDRAFPSSRISTARPRAPPAAS